jgi:glycosyltransferase involved in cell wall biosynthesis
MKKTIPLLSICIATKNREYYCIEVIKDILNTSEDIELCIADNSSTKKIADFIENIKDSRVKYEYDPNEISSIDNFNKCIELSTGEFVIMIGDDDTVLPTIYEQVKWMKQEEVDSLSFKYNIDYYWPNSSIEDFKLGCLEYIPDLELEYKRIETENRLLRLLQEGIIQYQFYELPRIYHGIIKRTILEEIKSKIGNFFDGLSPDIFSSVSLALLVENHYVSSKTFTIAGACNSSTSVQSLKGEHSGLLNNAPHFKNRHNYQWNSIIPAYYSVETIWAESAVNALMKFNRKDLLKNFDLNKFIIKSIILNRKFIFILSLKESLKVLFSNKKFIFSLPFKVLISLKEMYSRKLEIINTKKNKEINFLSIAQASKRITEIC